MPPLFREVKGTPFSLTGRRSQTPAGRCRYSSVVSSSSIQVGVVARTLLATARPPPPFPDWEEHVLTVRLRPRSTWYGVINALVRFCFFVAIGRPRTVVALERRTQSFQRRGRIQSRFEKGVTVARPWAGWYRCAVCPPSWIARLFRGTFIWSMHVCYKSCAVSVRRFLCPSTPGLRRPTRTQPLQVAIKA